jgi:hypothetical protein
VLTYLKLLNLPLGLVMNFGGGTFHEGLKRVVNNHRAVQAPPRSGNPLTASPS